MQIRNKISAQLQRSLSNLIQLSDYLNDHFPSPTGRDICLVKNHNIHDADAYQVTMRMVWYMIHCQQRFTTNDADGRIKTADDRGQDAEGWGVLLWPWEW